MSATPKKRLEELRRTYYASPGLINHDVQTHMIKSHLRGNETRIDSGKIKQKISEQLTNDLVNKISYKDENMRLKVTYELECNSSSGEIKFGNLVT